MRSWVILLIFGRMRGEKGKRRKVEEEEEKQIEASVDEERTTRLINTKSLSCHIASTIWTGVVGRIEED